MKNVQIRSYFWSVLSCIQSKYRKIRTRNNSVFGHFSRSVEVSSSASYFLIDKKHLVMIFDRWKLSLIGQFEINNFGLQNNNIFGAVKKISLTFGFCNPVNPMIYLSSFSKVPLTHFMPLIVFYTPWKYQETRGFLIIARGIERDQWHKMA